MNQQSFNNITLPPLEGEEEFRSKGTQKKLAHQNGKNISNLFRKRNMLEKFLLDYSKMTGQGEKDLELKKEITSIVKEIYQEISESSSEDLEGYYKTASNGVSKKQKPRGPKAKTSKAVKPRNSETKSSKTGKTKVKKNPKEVIDSLLAQVPAALKRELLERALARVDAIIYHLRNCIQEINDELKLVRSYLEEARHHLQMDFAFALQFEENRGKLVEACPPSQQKEESAVLEVKSDQYLNLVDGSKESFHVYKEQVEHLEKRKEIAVELLGRAENKVTKFVEKEVRKEMRKEVDFHEETKGANFSTERSIQETSSGRFIADLISRSGNYSQRDQFFCDKTGSPTQEGMIYQEQRKEGKIHGKCIHYVRATLSELAEKLKLHCSFTEEEARLTVKELREGKLKEIQEFPSDQQALKIKEIENKLYPVQYIHYNYKEGLYHGSSLVINFWGRVPSSPCTSFLTIKATYNHLNGVKDGVCTVSYFNAPGRNGIVPTETLRERYVNGELEGWCMRHNPLNSSVFWQEYKKGKAHGKYCEFTYLYTPEFDKFEFSDPWKEKTPGFNSSLNPGVSKAQEELMEKAQKNGPLIDPPENILNKLPFRCRSPGWNFICRNTVLLVETVYRNGKRHGPYKCLDTTTGVNYNPCVRKYNIDYYQKDECVSLDEKHPQGQKLSTSIGRPHQVEITMDPRKYSMFFYVRSFSNYLEANSH